MIPTHRTLKRQFLRGPTQGVFNPGSVVLPIALAQETIDSRRSLQ
jgi:hypothetical protein